MRHAAASTWASAALAKEDQDTRALWAIVGELSIDELGVYSLLVNSFAEVMAAYKDELMAPRTRAEWLGDVRAACSRLSDLLGDTFLDQNAFFYSSPGELEQVELVVRQNCAYLSSEPQSPTTALARAAARGLGRSIEPTRRELLDEAFAQIPVGDRGLAATLKTDEKMPSISTILARLSQSAHSDDTPSEFGARPASTRAQRKAFAKRVHQIGSSEHFWNSPHLKLIAAAVSILFGEAVDGTDLLG